MILFWQYGSAKRRYAKLTYKEMTLDDIADYSERMAANLGELRRVANDLYYHLAMASIRLSGDLYFQHSQAQVKNCLERAEKVLEGIHVEKN